MSSKQIASMEENNIIISIGAGSHFLAALFHLFWIGPGGSFHHKINATSAIGNAYAGLALCLLFYLDLPTLSWFFVLYSFAGVSFDLGMSNYLYNDPFFITFGAFVQMSIFIAMSIAALLGTTHVLFWGLLAGALVFRVFRLFINLLFRHRYPDDPTLRDLPAFVLPIPFISLIGFAIALALTNSVDAWQCYIIYVVSSMIMIPAYIMISIFKTEEKRRKEPWITLVYAYFLHKSGFENGLGGVRGKKSWDDINA
jgi:hypothetical protein